MADFDPDAYLASKTAVAEPPPADTGFDPDAYLKSKVAAPAEKPGIGSRIANFLKEKNTPEELAAAQKAYDDADPGHPMIGPMGGMLAGQRAGRVVPGGPLAVRLSSSVLASEGGLPGALISGGGEGLAQLMEGDFKPGEVVKQAGLGAVPIAKAKGVLNVIKDAGKMFGAGVAGEEARSLIDEHKISDKATLSGVIPGAITLAAPTLSKVGSKILNLATPEAEAAAKALASKNATRDASIKAGQEIGMALPPTSVNDTWFNRRLEGIAGGPRVGREANLGNQVAGDAAIRKDIGMEANAPATDTAITALKEKASIPYKKITALSENGGVKVYHDNSGADGSTRFLTTDKDAVKASEDSAAKFNPKNPLVVGAVPPKAVIQHAFDNGHDAVIVDNGGDRIDAFVPDEANGATIYKGSPIDKAAENLKDLKQARNDAVGYWRSDAKTYDPQNGVKAREAMEKADKLEEQIGTAAAQTGDPKLLDDYRAARTAYAKLENASAALNSENGTFNLNTLGKMTKKGLPLSGGLKTVGDFSSATEGKFTRPAAAIPNPGVSALELPAIEAAATTAGGGGGEKGMLRTALGAMGAAAGVAVRDPLRKFIVSPTGQRLLATPAYKAAIEANPELTKRITKLLAEQAADAQEKK